MRTDGPQTNSGFVTQPYLLSTALHFSRHLRFFGELASSLEAGPNGGPRPYDDGVLVRWQKKRWRVDGFAVRPVTLNPGVFDDPPDHERKFSGIFSGRIPETVTKQEEPELRDVLVGLPVLV